MKNKYFLNFFVILLLCQSFGLMAQSLDSTMGTNSTSVDSTFNSNKLTDEQAAEAKTFVHQGNRDAAIKKGCESIDNCDQNGASKGVLLPAMIEDNIGRLYVLLFAGTSFLSGGPKVTLKADPTPAAPATPPAATGATPETPATPEKKESMDYCMYGAMGSELVVGAIQMSQQNKAQQESAALNDPQLQALVNLKETHKARKRTSTLQSVAYGATAACYVARKVMQPSVAMDWKYMAKMSAAAGISALYVMKAKKHDDAMKKVQKVIDSLPKAGDCNPWTGTSCFCKATTSKDLYPSQYQEVCVLNKGDFETPLADLGCAKKVNNVVSLDEACTCKTDNSCMTSVLTSSSPLLGIGANFMNEANKGYELLDPSKFDSAALNDYASGTANSISRIKSKVEGSVPNPTLSGDQKKIADSLSGIVPSSVANVAATNPVGDVAGGGLMSNSTRAAIDKIPSNLKNRMGPEEISGNYRGGNGGGSEGVGSSDSGFTMPALPGQETPQSGQEILTFADRAIQRAEVNTNTEKPIFEAISDRYRKTGFGN